MEAGGVELILGGARSGKSRYAEARFDAAAAKTYVATATAGDEEMRARIAAHVARRGPSWRTVVEPFDLAGVLTREDGPILVDCLTLWLSNVMLADRDVAAEIETLGAALSRRRAATALVSNEVGLGLVPETPLGRAFRDAQGVLNQRVAALASRVVFVAAGLPLVLKDAP